MEKSEYFCARCIMWKCSSLDAEAREESNIFDGNIISLCLHINENKRADDYCVDFIEVL